MHAQTEEQTQTHTHTGRLLEPSLPCNLQRQHGPPPFQIEHMVQTQKTKQTGWPPWCTVHGVRLVFSSPLTRSIYTDSKSTPHLWLGLHTYIPVIIQTCIARRFLFYPLSPAFRFSELCLVSKVDQLQSSEMGRLIVEDKYYFIRDWVSDLITQTPFCNS